MTTAGLARAIGTAVSPTEANLCPSNRGDVLRQLVLGIDAFGVRNIDDAVGWNPCPIRHSNLAAHVLVRRGRFRASVQAAITG